MVLSKLIPSIIRRLGTAIPGLLLAVPVAAQDWYQVELTIFSNENPADRLEETWTPNRLDLEYPDDIDRFDHLLDLLLIDELVIAEEPEPEPVIADDAAAMELLLEEPDPDLLRLQQTGPSPLAADPDFKFFDLDRDPFVLLPDSFSDFQQTNRALERDGDHRVLFAGRWRQPVPDPQQARATYIEGGIDFGDFHELQGSITIRFNENRDRVVIDADLWLVELGFDIAEEELWPTPPTRGDLAYPALNPGQNLLPGESIRRIYRFLQSREMRSTEFHYLDHPAMGLIITVEPYEVPELSELEGDPFTPGVEPDGN